MFEHFLLYISRSFSMLSFENWLFWVCKPMLCCPFDFACLTTTQNRGNCCGCGVPEKAEPEGIFDEGDGGGERGRKRRKRKKWRERWKCPVYKCAYVGGLRGLRNDFKILHPPFLAKIIFLFACFQKKPTISTTLEYCMLVPCSLIQDMARFQPRFLLAPCLVSGSRGRVRRMLAKITT